MIKRALALVCLLTSSISSFSATLIIDNGVLNGASGVQILGKLYDLSFIETGSCITNFNGCNDPNEWYTDTTGGVSPNAWGNAAADALLEQVFIDSPEGNFDSDLSVTAGWERGAHDVIYYIPLTTTPSNSHLTIAYVRNYSLSSGVEDFTGLSNTPKTQHAGGSAAWAIFTPTPVPIPSAAWLFGSALIGIAGIKLKK